MRRVMIVLLLIAPTACSGNPSPEASPSPAPSVAVSAEPAQTASAASTAPAPSAAPAPTASAAAEHPAPCPANAPAPPATPWAALVQDKGCKVLFNYNTRKPSPDDVIAVEAREYTSLAKSITRGDLLQVRDEA